MPANFIPAADFRTCPHPDHEGARDLPFTPENFYTRPNGTTDYWCRECVRRYNRLNRAARRARGERTRPASGRKFGVEVECIVDRASLMSELRARGLSVYDARYTHQVMSQWKVVTDASVYNGYELVSPPLRGAQGIAQLKLACEALVAAGATVNRSCGLHVHHEVSDLNTNAFGRLFRAWSDNQGATDGLVAASRRSSQWCRPLSSTEVRTAETLPSMESNTVRRHFMYADRYRSLNVAAFPRYGTVEVRQHQGTIAFSKIAAWVAYGQAMIAWAASDAAITAHGSTDALLDTLASHGLTAAQVTYLKDRASHFSGRRQAVAA